MILSIFTPTYNRAHLLERVYDSLKDQRKEFEWIIVDDGSEDDTSLVVERLKSKAEFPIKYIKKENGGKHTAHNCAVAVAEGEYFVCVDSDDWLSPNAVELIATKTAALSNDDCAFVAYKEDSQGNLLSVPFLPNMPIHFPMNKGISDFAHPSEYCFIFKTDVLKKYPFPFFEDEKFVGECVLYDRMELDQYTAQCFPNLIEVCEYQSDGLSANIYATLLKNPTGYQIYHMQRIDLVATFKERVRHCICYHSFKHLSKNKEYVYHGKYALLVTLLTPTGICGALYYKMRYKRNKI